MTNRIIVHICILATQNYPKLNGGYTIFEQQQISYDECVIVTHFLYNPIFPCSFHSTCGEFRRLGEFYILSQFFLFLKFLSVEITTKYVKLEMTTLCFSLALPEIQYVFCILLARTQLFQNYRLSLSENIKISSLLSVPKRHADSTIVPAATKQTKSMGFTTSPANPGSSGHPAPESATQ
ncbi:uncharacterized protein LOC129756820 [Uranotaenia lowii]|uniref:uncharacterized protein LOC129756820 n=1 Tax=Uranotaenia lowii TaxID=190385 RepID=UPI002479FFDE|nr:uncharacterized protein LOC129756820 [Uranotaenia lowii]